MLLFSLVTLIVLSAAGGFVAGRAYGIEVVIARFTRALGDS